MKEKKYKVHGKENMLEAVKDDAKINALIKEFNL